MKEYKFLGEAVLISLLGLSSFFFQEYEKPFSNNIFSLNEYLKEIPEQSNILANGAHILEFYFKNYNYTDLKSLNKLNRGFYKRDGYTLVNIEEAIIAGQFSLIIISKNSNYIEDDFNKLNSYGFRQKKIEGYNLFFKQAANN